MFERIKRFFGFEKVLVIRDAKTGASELLRDATMLQPMVDAGFEDEAVVLLSTTFDLADERRLNVQLEAENNRLTFEQNACCDLLSDYGGVTLRDKIRTLIVANAALSIAGTQTAYLSTGGDA